MSSVQGKGDGGNRIAAVVGQRESSAIPTEELQPLNRVAKPVALLVEAGSE